MRILLPRWVLLGLLGLCAAAGTLAQDAPSTNGKVQLNLEDSDIRQLINTVARYTNTNFVVDQRVKADVTVVSPRPMPPEELYQVFLSVLDVHGYSAIDVGDITKIVPSVNAKQGPIPSGSERVNNRGDELITHVVPVEHVKAAQMVPILRPLVPQQGHLAAYTPTNILLISDSAANVKRLLRIIARIDVPTTEEVEVIQLEHASAQELIQVIQNLLQTNDRNQQVNLTLAADPRTNSLLMSGDKQTRMRVRGLLAHLDTPPEGSGNTEVMFLKYAKAEDLVPILQGISESRQEGKRQPKDNEIPVNIQADKANNALVVTAAPEQLRNLRSVVEQLDIRRAQVLVEAVIAEVSTELSKELGIQWLVDGTGLINGDADSGPLGAINFGAAGVIQGVASGDFSAIPAGGLLGMGDLRDNRTNFAALINALQGDAASNVLSTPTLVTMDNEEAEIVVGQNVPFLTGQFTSTGSGDGVTNPFQTIERQDVGLNLKLTPQINDGNNIKMDIELENSSIASSSVSASDLITNTNTIKTSVLVEHNQILVLGGLTQDRFSDNVQKIPGLGDIPLLGQLFRSTKTEKTKRNLMLFVHPAILRDVDTADKYTQHKYRFLQSWQRESGVTERGLIRDAGKLFPDLDKLMTRLPETTSDESP